MNRIVKLTGRLAFGLFLISSVANLLGVYLGWHILAVCAKPLIVSSLALHCWALLRENSVGGSGLLFLMLAMAFGTLGDILLIFNGQGFFLAGLLAFLVGHFFYFLTIDYSVIKPAPVLSLRMLLLYALMSFMIVTAQQFGVKGFLGMCVSVYACAFAFCVHAAIMAAVDTKSRNYLWTIVGYVLFIISDSILATGAFTDIKIPKRGFLVMLTYILAQLLIAVSLTREEIRKHNAIKTSSN